MSDCYITDPAEPPRESVTVIPRRLTYAYGGHKDGVDAIELRAEDRAGVTTVLVLDAVGAQHIATHLQSMLSQLGDLRHQYDNMKGNDR